MKKKIIILSTSIILLLTTLSFAILTPELNLFYSIQKINNDLWIAEILLIIVTFIRKKDINRIFALLFIIWTIISIILLYKANYNWIVYMPGIILGIIITIYTILVNYTKNKSSKGEKENVRND